MFFVVFYLVFANFLIRAQSQIDDLELHKNGTKECFASFLKNLSLIEESFPNQPYPLISYQQCEVLRIKPTLDQFNVDVIKYLGFSGSFEVKPYVIRNYRKFEECVIRLFGKYNLMLLYLKGLTFHLYNITSVSDYQTEFANDRRFFVHRTLNACDTDNLDQKFNKLRRWNVKKDHEDLCKRKYLFENGIIDPIEWNIKRPRFNIRNCFDVNKTFEDKVDMLILTETSTFFGIHVPAASNCIYEKYKKIKLNQEREAIKVMLTDYMLNGEKIVRLRLKFFTLETAAAEITIECLALTMTIAVS